MNNDMNLHAHIEKNSRDCDGSYTNQDVVVMESSELLDDAGDILFMQRMMGTYASPFAVMDAMVEITEYGFDYHERTDEGFLHIDVRWCRDESCNKSSHSQLDLAAEAAGY